jgi:Ca-activated chloride channel family protein
MKLHAIAFGLATSLGASLFAGETLRLKVEPDHEYLLAGSPQEVVVKIDLLAEALKKKSKRTPLNLAVVLDRSGSMSGAKIEKARQAAMELVDRLSPDDIISFIIYSDRAEVVFPAQRVEDKEALKERISRVRTHGSTALYAGVELGAEQVERHLTGKRINRVILLSDGLANVGPSSPAELRRLGGRLSERGVSVTTIGVGDDYNEDLMAGLAEASDANYYYVKDTEKLPEIFARELGEMLTVAAREIRIEITCPEGVRPLGFIARPEKFERQKATIQLSQLTSAQNRYLFLKCQAEGNKPELAHVKVRYLDEMNGGAEQVVSETATVRYTTNRKQVEDSVRPEIAAQKELFVTAVAKKEALACADAGRYEQAAEKLEQQVKSLDAKCASAPAPLQTQLREEIDNLRMRSDEFRKNQYSAGSRKSLQNEAWITGNSKK